MNEHVHPLFAGLLEEAAAVPKVVELAAAMHPDLESDESQLRRERADLAADKYVLGQELARERATCAAEVAPLKRKELVKGAVYRIRLSDGKWVDGVFLYEREYLPYSFSQRRVVRYVFTNAKTGRDVTLKSMARVRRAAEVARG